MSNAPKSSRVMDLVGHRYGRLVVLRFAGRHKGASMWICACDCAMNQIYLPADYAKDTQEAVGVFVRNAPVKRTRRMGMLGMVGYQRHFLYGPI